MEGKIALFIRGIFKNPLILLHYMSDNISLLEGMGIHWKEDQPVTRHVRQQMEKDGTIRTLVDLLLSDKNSQEARQSKSYCDSGGVEQDYLCIVSRLREEFRHSSSPDFKVHIKPDIDELPWDAIGDVYISNIPKWLKESVE